MGSDIFQLVEEALESLRPELRASAADDIDLLLRSKQLSVAGISRLLRDEAADVRERAAGAWVAGAVRLVDLTDDLKKAVLRTRDAAVVWEASKSLCVLDPEAAPVFLELLLTGKTTQHRTAAIYALGRLRSRSASPELVRILADRSEASDVRAHAAEALGYIGDASAVAPLIQSVRDPLPEIRFWSVFALGELGDESASDVLTELSQTDHAAVADYGTISDEASAALRAIREVP